MNEYGINHYAMYSELKASIGKHYIKSIEQIIKMAPKEVTDNSLLKNIFNNVKVIDERKPKFKVEEFVHISKQQIQHKVYYLESYDREPIKGGFLELELEKLISPNEYLVDRIIKRKKYMALVRWRGLSKAHASWADVSHRVSILVHDADSDAFLNHSLILSPALRHANLHEQAKTLAPPRATCLGAAPYSPCFTPISSRDINFARSIFSYLLPVRRINSPGQLKIRCCLPRETVTLALKQASVHSRGSALGVKGWTSMDRPVPRYPKKVSLECCKGGGTPSVDRGSQQKKTLSDLDEGGYKQRVGRDSSWAVWTEGVFAAKQILAVLDRHQGVTPSEKTKSVLEGLIMRLMKSGLKPSPAYYYYSSPSCWRFLICLVVICGMDFSHGAVLFRWQNISIVAAFVSRIVMGCSIIRGEDGDISRPRTTKLQSFGPLPQERSQHMAEALGSPTILLDVSQSRVAHAKQHQHISIIAKRAFITGEWDVASMRPDVRPIPAWDQKARQSCPQDPVCHITTGRTRAIWMICNSEKERQRDLGRKRTFAIAAVYSDEVQSYLVPVCHPHFNPVDSNVVTVYHPNFNPVDSYVITMYYLHFNTVDCYVVTVYFLHFNPVDSYVVTVYHLHFNPEDCYVVTVYYLHFNPVYSNVVTVYCLHFNPVDSYVVTVYRLHFNPLDSYVVTVYHLNFNPVDSCVVILYHLHFILIDSYVVTMYHQHFNLEDNYVVTVYYLHFNPVDSYVVTVYHLHFNPVDSYVVTVYDLHFNLVDSYVVTVYPLHFNPVDSYVVTVYHPHFNPVDCYVVTVYYLHFNPVDCCVFSVYYLHFNPVDSYVVTVYHPRFTPVDCYVVTVYYLHFNPVYSYVVTAYYLHFNPVDSYVVTVYHRHFNPVDSYVVTVYYLHFKPVDSYVVSADYLHFNPEDSYVVTVYHQHINPVYSYVVSVYYVNFTLETAMWLPLERPRRHITTSNSSTTVIADRLERPRGIYKAFFTTEMLTIKRPRRHITTSNSSTTEIADRLERPRRHITTSNSL
ncbi:hypothetical protein PR048_025621, partial [Dryococelus australis]